MTSSRSCNFMVGSLQVNKNNTSPCKGELSSPKLDCRKTQMTQFSLNYLKGAGDFMIVRSLDFGKTP